MQTKINSFRLQICTFQKVVIVVYKKITAMAGNQGSSFRPTNSGLAEHMGTVETCPHLLFEYKFTRVADYIQHIRFATHKACPNFISKCSTGPVNGAIYIYDQPWHLCTNNRKNSSKFHIWTREATNFVRI